MNDESNQTILVHNDQLHFKFLLEWRQSDGTLMGTDIYARDWDHAKEIVNSMKQTLTIAGKAEPLQKVNDD
jgi:hypothetical protein